MPIIIIAPPPPLRPKMKPPLMYCDQIAYRITLPRPHKNYASSNRPHIIHTLYANSGHKITKFVLLVTQVLDQKVILISQIHGLLGNCV